MDQAETLRRQMLKSQGKLGKAIAVVSGKGGVGKSNFSINFATELSSKGYKVILLDMDIGMGNVHILVGHTADNTILDYLEGEQPIMDVVQKGPGGLFYISGGSGLNRMVEWKDIQVDRLLRGFEDLQKEYDYLIFDMGAGASANGLELITAVDEVIVITTSEPTSIMDAYSMMKFIYLRDQEKKFSILCNRVMNPEEGKQALSRLQIAMRRFLNKEVHILGSIPEDSTVRKAVSEQSPFVASYPDSKAAKTLKLLATHYIDQSEVEVHASSNHFIQKLTKLFSKR
ncbi:MinD/ParA family protein [Jeotgalibacillus soli]|nr:MinD/ParA family protein [Jeotgalibacillus soli]